MWTQLTALIVKYGVTCSALHVDKRKQLTGPDGMVGEGYSLRLVVA